MSAMNAYPPGPSLGSLRLATPSDILRMGIVATAGSSYSSLSRWFRPHHEDYPEDTLLSYRTQFRDALKNDDVIILVSEDSYESDEQSSTEAIIPSKNGWSPPTEGEKVIVGVASIKLEPGSKLPGQFKDNHESWPELPVCEDRDVSQKHYDSFLALVGAGMKERCPDDANMAMLVVHPAYWSRGHGTKLVKWATQLSDLYAVKMSVCATVMGKKLYSRLGFQDICRITADGDEDDSRGASTDLMEYRP